MVDTGSGTGVQLCYENELLKLQKSGQFPDDIVKIKGVQIQYVCILPDVLSITGILGGLLLQSV